MWERKNYISIKNKKWMKRMSYIRKKNHAKQLYQHCTNSPRIYKFFYNRFKNWWDEFTRDVYKYMHTYTHAYTYKYINTYVPTKKMKKKTKIKREREIEKKKRKSEIKSCVMEWWIFRKKYVCIAFLIRIELFSFFLFFNIYNIFYLCIRV